MKRTGNSRKAKKLDKKSRQDMIWETAVPRNVFCRDFLQNIFSWEFQVKPDASIFS